MDWIIYLCLLAFLCYFVLPIVWYLMVMTLAAVVGAVMLVCQVVWLVLKTAFTR